VRVIILYQPIGGKQMIDGSVGMRLSQCEFNRVCKLCQCYELIYMCNLLKNTFSIKEIFNDSLPFIDNGYTNNLSWLCSNCKGLIEIGKSFN